MSDKTHIEWTDSTWPVVQGCDPVSPGCTNCYAVGVLNRLAANPNPKISAPLKEVTETHKGKLRFTGKVALREDRLDWPLKWKKPRMIFVPSHGDLFHKDVPDAFIDRVFAMMAVCRPHKFQVLTKRADRMRDYVNRANDQWQGNSDSFADRFQGAMDWNYAWINDIDDMEWPLPNVWLGVSAEDQQRANERIPDLLDTPAAIRFVSAEPLLGAIDLNRICLVPQKPGSARAGVHIDALTGKFVESGLPYADRGLDWAICGGESGKDARPMHPAWVQSLRDQCAAYHVPFFFKQWGSWRPAHPGDPFAAGKWMHVNGDTFGPVEGEAFYPAPLSTHVVRSGKKAAGALLDGVEHKQFPTPA